MMLGELASLVAAYTPVCLEGTEQPEDLCRDWQGVEICFPDLDSVSHMSGDRLIRMTPFQPVAQLVTIKRSLQIILD